MIETNIRKTGVMTNMKMLYMYDVRGIQDYIFKTNKIKEIVGASSIVEKIIIDIFEECAEVLNVKVESEYNPDDKLKFKFDDTNTVDAEILYYGGGNLLVLYNDDKQAEMVSKKMCVELVKKTYSLQLAVAKVEITGDYHADYQNLRKEMDRVKLNMPMSLPISGFPITLNDPQTGYAFSKMFEDKKCTYEAYSKLKEYKKLFNENSKAYSDFGTFENDSLVAVVHIDGNNMGKQIAEQMKSVSSYEMAAKICRKFSKDIEHSFVEVALKSVEDKVEYFCEKVGLNLKQYEAFRKIISAGDDITFICNAKIALACVNEFMSKLDGYSACGGIYVCHAHFPFARAYEYSEQLCSSAKKRSRIKDGNYVDFHINYGGILNDLDAIRESQYKVDQSLIARPYSVGEAKDGGSSLSELLSMLDMFKESNVARTQLKGLREAFVEGNEVVKYELLRINSRLSIKLDIEEKDYPLLFDAIEVMDLKWGERDE